MVFFRKAALIVIVLLWGALQVSAEMRNEISYLRGDYNGKFFDRHNRTFRIGSAFHYAHAKQHDILLITSLVEHVLADSAFDAESVHVIHGPPRTEPAMEYYGPYTARIAWRLYRAIDWSHMHHEQTYDILSDNRIPWSAKKEWTDRAVRYYLDKNDVPRSPAPLEVTMRRAGVMMKPYFTMFRNLYPHSNKFFYVAHWWHPAVYEAMMRGGNGSGQDRLVLTVDEVLYDQVLRNRPRRMLLSREVMPRYSRMSPESANIFDNLHMLHGIAYDILAYGEWTHEQKRKELYRVIEAMGYQPGDEKLARKFRIPRPEADPGAYEEWMRGSDGEMNRIMMEMMEEMLPLMTPGGSRAVHSAVMDQVRMKLAPGIQKGERPGSLANALKQVMPEMKMKPHDMDPGVEPVETIRVMLEAWKNKNGNMPDIEPLEMKDEPV
ncbi:MAG TPA: hypothetical protein PK587_02245 [Syntrophales bacterium]|nr:hypothetical protein [Syntrophales bacterium]